MRYSEMGLRQRQWLLANPENYPLRIDFLGKTGLLGFEAVALLVRHGVDFDVDDDQITKLLSEQENVVAPMAAPEPEQYQISGLTTIIPSPARQAADMWAGAAVIVGGIGTVAYLFLRLICRPRASVGQQNGSRGGTPAPAERAAEPKKGGMSITERVRQQLPEVRFLLSLLREAGHLLEETEASELQVRQRQGLR